MNALNGQMERVAMGWAIMLGVADVRKFIKVDGLAERVKSKATLVEEQLGEVFEDGGYVEEVRQGRTSTEEILMLHEKGRSPEQIAEILRCSLSRVRDSLINERKLKKNNNGRKGKPIIQTTLDGEFVNEHVGRSQAARDTGISRSAIWFALVGRTESTGGYKWHYKEDLAKSGNCYHKETA